MHASAARRRLVIGLAACTLLTGSSAFAADAPWPSRPVHIVVGFPAGTSPDTVARIVAEPLAKALGQAVVVDNKPGASGNTGVDLVAKSTDGHTFGFTTNGPLTTSKQLFAKLPYDPVRDLKPLSLAATSPLVLVTDADLPPKTLQEFIAWDKAQKDGATYGSVGQGSGSHLTMELFASRTGLQMVHVPYQGFPQVTNAMLGHQVQSGFMAPSGALAQAKGGKLRMLAVSSPQRSPLLPDVPTVAEAAGVADFRSELMIAAFGPAAMTPEVASRLSREINAVLQQPDVRDKLFQQGWQAIGGSPEVLTKRITDDTAIWSDVIKKANVHLE